jgi:hypothetical protein
MLLSTRRSDSKLLITRLAGTKGCVAEAVGEDLLRGADSIASSVASSPSLSREDIIIFAVTAGNQVRPTL